MYGLLFLTKCGYLEPQERFLNFKCVLLIIKPADGL